MRIRAFETVLMARPDHGFQLLSSGQEAVAVGLCSALSAQDQLLTSGRSIAPALARGLDAGGVMAELLGRVAGFNRGKGGRGHLAHPAAGFFGAHAVVGGNMAVAAGVALAFVTHRRPAAVACLFGDGACGSGALYETLNLAALWRLPLVFVCDNNRFSVSTAPERALAPKRLSDLATPFGIPARTVDGMDVLAVRYAADAFLQRAREGQGPAFLECLSERFYSHSTATRETRTPQQIMAAKARCPIERLGRRLLHEGALDALKWAAIETEVRAEADQALAFALSSPFPDVGEAVSDVV